ncbi:MAG: DUF1576 domain-containing protein, partial [Streptococcaceae bacterium]|nr:DUF1576 domain-containing protein [Streptococcaceae bacterium]
MKREAILVKSDETIKYLFLVALCLLLMSISFVFNHPTQIIEGLLAIHTAPSMLLTDYIAVSSVGATLFNVGLLTLISVFIVKYQK